MVRITSFENVTEIASKIGRKKIVHDHVVLLCGENIVAERSVRFHPYSERSRQPTSAKCPMNDQPKAHIVKSNTVSSSISVEQFLPSSLLSLQVLISALCVHTKADKC